MKRVERPFHNHLESTDIRGVSFIAEPNAILSRNIGAEAGFLCDQVALLEGGGGGGEEGG